MRVEQLVEVAELALLQVGVISYPLLLRLVQLLAVLICVLLGNRFGLLLDLGLRLALAVFSLSLLNTLFIFHF